MRSGLNNVPVPGEPRIARRRVDDSLASASCRSSVVEVVGGDALARRLTSVGFWPGVVVEKIGAAPFGDPLLFRLHGYRIALRREEARRVLVEEYTGE